MCHNGAKIDKRNRLVDQKRVRRESFGERRCHGNAVRRIRERYKIICMLVGIVEGRVEGPERQEKK
jgi:hypothetical protein